jgi:hypothetical protein
MPLHGGEDSLATRAKRALAFVAIVWAVAGSYVAFDVASYVGLDLVQSHPDLFGDLLLSRATRQSTACVVAPGERAGGAAGTLSASQARAASWLLGTRLGSAAMVRQHHTADPQVLEPMVADMSRLAELLGVPAPVVFVPRQMANAHPEFTQFVEADVHETAHQLAVRYSPQACELYKLGAFWAYSAAVRVVLGDKRATHDAEIRYHARKAALPEPLWRPLLEPPHAADGAERAANNEAVTAGVTKYLMTQPSATE